jgi:PAS domain S-box-containing protein
MHTDNQNRSYYALLEGLRAIDRLVTREKDPAVLIKRACELLVRSHGFDTCTIILTDGGTTTMYADAGTGPTLANTRDILTRGKLPNCVKAVLEDQDFILRGNAGITCVQCPVKAAYSSERDSAAIRLESGGKTFGALFVSAPDSFTTNHEEQALCREMADDIAFALDGMEKEQKRARAIDALRGTRDYLDAIVSASPAAIYTLDPDGIVTHWNKAAERIFGWSATEAIGRVLPTVRPEADGEFRALLKKIISGDTMSGLELERLRKDGTTVYISLSTAPLKDANGAHIGAVAIATDVSSRRRMELDIQERMKELRCLYRMTEVYTQGLTLDQTFEIFVNDIPSAYRNPCEVGARITIDSGVFQTSSFSRTTCCQSSVVKVRGKVKGIVEVCKLGGDDTDPDDYFEREKQALLDTVAGRIGLFMELRSTQDWERPQETPGGIHAD